MKTKPFFLFCTFFLFGFCYAQAQDRVILTIAGTGAPAYSGDGGSAISACLNAPIDVHIDGSGHIYIADEGNNCIRKIDTSGIITTIAGNGTLGYSGDSGLATVARLDAPHGIVVDRAGNIYICDDGNQVIRKVNTTGIITTIAGNGFGAGSGSGGYNGDGIAATAAEFNNPFHIALDSFGNIYIADVNNYRVRKVDTSDIITTIAGNGTLGYSGDGGPATTAQLGFPKGVAIDNAGNICIGDQDNARLRAVNTSGIINTIAGTGIGGFSGDGGPATTAQLLFPVSITFDYLGNMYFADAGNNNIRKIDTAGIITTIAGNGTSGYSGDGGPAIVAQLANPDGVATDSFGLIYIADESNNRIRILDYAPVFTGGHIQSMTTCMDSMQQLDTLLTIIDSDARQTETWSLVAGPIHGSATISYTTISTGNILIPSGLTYTPLAGYVGTDTFRVRVTDRYVSDTTTICAMVGNCDTRVNTVNPSKTALSVYPDPNNGNFIIDLVSNANEEAQIVITNMTGEKVKKITTLTNTFLPVAIDMPAGVYFLNVITAHGNWSKQIIVTP